MYSGGPSSPAWATRCSPRLPGALEHLAEFAWRIAPLGAVQPHATEVGPALQGRVQGGLGLLFRTVAQKAEKQPAADPQLAFPLCQRLADPPEGHLNGNAAGSVSLGVKKGFHMDHAIGGRSLQPGPGQVVEVLFSAQYIGTLVVEVQKGLEVAELVGPSQRFFAGPGQFDPVASGQLKHQLRLQGTLQMQVQLRLGQGAQKCGTHCAHLPSPPP